MGSLEDTNISGTPLDILSHVPISSTANVQRRLRPLSQKDTTALFGIVNIHKPAGVTSRFVVDRVERLVRPEKAGHAGTLDPLATGVLLVCVGRATRLVEYVQRLPKRYRATFLLGHSSPTDDVDGEVLPLPDAPIPTRPEIVQALPQFVGSIMQRPPAYSAVHVNGQRAYALARRGRQVELDARPVEIHSLRLVDYNYPELQLDMECGSGTYVRSLGRDLAAILHTAAIMSALARTAIGHFELADAQQLDELTPENLSSYLRSPLEALRSFPHVELEPSEITHICHGRAITRTAAGVLQPSAASNLASLDEQEKNVEVIEEVIAIDRLENLVAILNRYSDDTYRPKHVFAQTE